MLWQLTWIGVSTAHKLCCPLYVSHTVDSTNPYIFRWHSTIETWKDQIITTLHHIWPTCFLTNYRVIWIIRHGVKYRVDWWRFRRSYRCVYIRMSSHIWVCNQGDQAAGRVRYTHPSYRLLLFTFLIFGVALSCFSVSSSWDYAFASLLQKSSADLFAWIFWRIVVCDMPCSIMSYLFYL